MALKNQLKDLFKNRPEYSISDQYYDNQALARSAAYGRDQAIQRQETNLEQEAADAMGVASQYSNSASGILSTLEAISGNKNQALRNLAVDEAAIGNQKLQNLYAANVGLAEEEDKAFEYNVNMPYQKKIEHIQQQIRRRQQLVDSTIAGLISVGGKVATGGMK